jgi:hypothetical protein
VAEVAKLSGLTGASQAAEKVLFGVESIPQRLKPNSLQSIYVRPEGRTLQGTISFPQAVSFYPSWPIVIIFGFAYDSCGVAWRERAPWFFAAAKIRDKEKDDADNKFQGPVT